MEIRYTGASQDMSFTLIDHNGDVLAEATDVPTPLNISLDDTPEADRNPGYGKRNLWNTSRWNQISNSVLGKNRSG